ncbi:MULTISPECIES: hypothetical protein [Flavobacterium]|uniref:hypothetical protein n=1 Tax=Flavobacterium TaxID=237 RepID=UPI001FCC308E|nr:MULTISPECIES: hypothetical protein [Flavobacterium]UOK42213.1 hypothetical protein LZF87_12950 [Flavobacterium enshiense]
MVEIIWGILNIAILIYFVIVCFKSTKIIREKLGVFAALIFVFGLLSFVAVPKDESSKTKSFHFSNNKFHGNTYLKSVKLEDNLATEIELTVKFGENEKEKKILSAHTNRNGFVSGTNWKVEAVSVENSKKENKYLYEVSGILEWKILGLKIYSESKYFKGNIKLTK